MMISLIKWLSALLRLGTHHVTAFDDIVRDDEAHASEIEPKFSYLNRSNRREAQQVRSLIDEWLARYPAAHQNSMVARIRSDIDDQHLSAYFELFLHELLLRTENVIIAVEPQLENSRYSPDFLVEAPNGERFYVEAVIATNRSREETAAQARLNQAIHAIDTIGSPAHFLSLTTRGYPTAPISLRALQRQLSNWIQTLPDDDSANEVPPFWYEEHGARFRISAFHRHRRRQASRAIGARMLPLQRLSPGEGVRSAVEAKASRYGRLALPYVVAVNALGIHEDEDNALDALFGTPVVRIRRLENGEDEILDDRNSDGVWFGPQGPRRLGLSAVLSFDRIDPWQLSGRRGRLVRSPHATLPLPPMTFGLDEWGVDSDQMRRTLGRSITELFLLPEGWPETHDDLAN